MISKATAAIAFLVTILAANYVTTRYGMWPVGLGLTATAGTYFAGLSFVLRDAVQDLAGRAAVVLLIVLGCGLSYAVSASSIATASAAAFLVSEATDFAIYSPLRKRGYLRAAVASNAAGALLDTWLFLTVAGFPLASAFAGQLVGKLLVTLAVVGLVVTWRSRKAVPA